MKLKTVYIKNFRNIDELKLDLEPLTVLVGENNIGKTNILLAIQKILKMDESPTRIRFDEEDFFYDPVSKLRRDEIKIELVFSDLNDNDTSAFVDSGIDIAKNQLTLRLHATWEQDNRDASIEVFFVRPDDLTDEKGEKLNLILKKYIPFFYISAYRDIHRETKYSSSDLKQIFKNYPAHF